MNNYIVKNKSIKKTEIVVKNSFSAFSFRKILCPNPNTRTLKSLIESSVKGFEPGSNSYIKFTDNFFVRIGELSDREYTFNINESTLKIIPPEKQKNIIKKNDICYQTASNVGNVCIFRGEKAYYNSHIRKLELKEKKEYIFSFLKSNFGKNQVEVGGSIKGVDNFNKDLLLNVIIPFPTSKNHKNPRLIEEYVSLLTLNIIDKEEQIAKKSKLIDEMFIAELSKVKKSSTIYKLPTISILKSGNRLDTMIYSKKYFEYDTLIKSYQNGFYFLNNTEVSPGKTPKDYYYSAIKKSDKFYEWVTPKNVNGRKLDYKTFVYTKSETKISKNSIVLNGIRYVGNGIYVDSNDKIFSNQNTLIINKFKNKEEQIFLYTFLTSEIGKYMQMAQRNFGIVPILYVENLCKIPIPQFEKDIKKEIIQVYFNPINRNNTAGIDNYLNSEKERNSMIGIHQLNEEIFVLRGELDKIINKIIKEEPIEISL
ncbi:hypothetical protein IUY40_01405 [Flavobacterium sp. ALJ2]|uniref:restriction endonuclease subunit S n=1 Tax=Flavobacterium sp. ALJ2 TaxID=2786960 RepID=UPI00189DCB66|nr:restriction endonuclease subunit S [Flavobacterium sp. ALJ2]MBF7090199.1 hypothetical protein [Flavobacterium sp. ALJ2]